MAVKNIIAKGIGFLPGSVRYIVTHGFEIRDAAIEFFGAIKITPVENVFLSVNPEPVNLTVNPDIVIVIGIG